VKLILLPGLDGTGELFEPLLEHLADDFEPQVVSYPGEGDQTYAELLEVVRAALPRSEAYVVLGWSFSGPLALTLAATAPPNLRGVILCASFESNPQPLLGWLAPLAQPPLFRLFPLFSQAKALLGGYSNPDLRRRLASAHAKAGATALSCRVRQVLGLRDSALARQCPVPLLYVAGDRDRVVPRRNVRAIAQSVPVAEVVTLRGPHLVLLTDPEAAAAAISQFCRRVGAV
jgi:pimeloyl-ACP methyl ester carboxylesterase